MAMFGEEMNHFLSYNRFWKFDPLVTLGKSIKEKKPLRGTLGNRWNIKIDMFGDTFHQVSPQYIFFPFKGGPETNTIQLLLENVRIELMPQFSE